MSIDEIRKRKAKLEIDMQMEIQKLLDGFVCETGELPSSIDVDIIEKSEIGASSQCLVYKVNVEMTI